MNDDRTLLIVEGLGDGRAGHHDDGYGRERRLRAHRPNDFCATEPGHQVIGNDEVRSQRLHHRKAFGAVLGAGDAIAVAFEKESKELTNVDFIVDD